MKKIMIFVLMFTACAFGTVDDGESIRQYFDCDGGTINFLFTQPANSEDDIEVYKHLISTGAETALIEDTDYTIVATGSNYLNGGTVTISPALANTFQVVIVRSIKKSQETSQGAITPTSVVASLDKLTRIVQDLQDRNDRSIHLPESDSESFDMELGDLSERASKNIGFDSDGKLVSTAEATTSVAFGAFGTTLVTAATIDAAQILLSSATAALEVGELTVADIIKSGPIIDVRSGGATGDGVTDDGAFVQASIEALTEGQTLYFPIGTYLLTTYTPPTITVGINIIGDGMETVTITGPDTSTDFINIGVGGNLNMKNVGFSTFDVVVDGGANAADYTILDSCKADTIQRFYSVATAAVVDIARVNNCEISNASEFGVAFRCEAAGYLAITDNNFTTIGGAGNSRAAIACGTDGGSADNDAFIITGNLIKGVSGGNNIYGILCYGLATIIADNVVEDISSTDGTDTEGIYTKCVYSIVIGNTCRNASEEQASIQIKGSERDGAASFGHSNIVANNTIFYSSTSAYAYTGIRINTSDCIVSGNYIENAEKGITSLSEDGCVISNNYIYNTAIGIQLFASSNDIKGCVITGNKMKQLNAVGETDGIGISLNATSGSIDMVTISNNVIDVIETSDSSKGIDLTTTTGEFISRINITGNHFRTMTKGIEVDLDSGSANAILIDNNHFTSSGATAADVIDALAYAGTSSWMGFNIGYASIPALANDATPVAGGHDKWETGGTTTITDFDGGVEGQIITVLCKHSLTFDTTTAQDADHNLDGSSADITAATGDILMWLCEDGTTWQLISNNDASADNN